MKQFIWNLAERAEWFGWRPRRFWSWLLRRTDRAHGYSDLSEVVQGIVPQRTPLMDSVNGSGSPHQFTAEE